MADEPMLKPPSSVWGAWSRVLAWVWSFGKFLAVGFIGLYVIIGIFWIVADWFF